MSTNYVLLANNGCCIEVLEHSNKFDLGIPVGAEESYCDYLNDLTLEELKELNQQLTNVISYFDPDYHECKAD